MKERYPHVGISRLCRLLGVSRQAYYQHFWRKESISIEQQLILDQVLIIRKNHRHMGTRKLYEKLQPFMLDHQIKIGRDALFDLLALHGLLVRKKRSVRTTNSSHWLRKWTNLIKEFTPCQPNELWVSDITYWKTKQGFYFISLITDAYSHKIIGYNVASNLETIESVKALKMALLALKGKQEDHFKLIHHSDRGIQYCSSSYVDLLRGNNISISMTESGDPLDNAIAERINGIIKYEYLHDYDVNNLQVAKELLESVVYLYNNERPHMSIGMLTPNHVHENKIVAENLWKTGKSKTVNLF